MELELINLKKTYGTVQALKGINYKFTSGIYGILGSNGAGKSTMINLITDNISRDKINGGSILYSQDKEKKDILKLGKNFRKIVGYMPQQQGFYTCSASHLLVFSFSASITLIRFIFLLGISHL